MNKRILCVVITLPVVLALGISSMVFTQSVSEMYVDQVRELEELARAGDMAGAQKMLTDIATEWREKETFLQLWVVHQDTDTVTRHIIGVQVGLTLGDEALFFDHSAQLIEALRHLHHRDDLTLGNVL